MEPGGGGGEMAAAISGSADRLSALSDDVLVQILRPLGTPDAVRTSLVSRRWRRVWSLLPELRVPSLPGDPIRFRDALAGHQVRLRFLQVLAGAAAAAADPKSLAIWLPAAAARVSGHFALAVNEIPPPAAAEEKGDGIVELPCFEGATGISIRLGHLGLAMPPPAAGVFARLASLQLECVWFEDPSELGDAIAARCPCLQHLRLCHTHGMYTLTVRSKTLVRMELEELHGLWELTVDAPELRELSVVRCLLDDDLVAAISAPRLESLEWKYSAGERASVELGEMRHLRSLGKLAFFVYGQQDLMYNRTTVQFLQRFPVIETLKLMLVYLPKINSFQYLMEEMNVLPYLTNLHLIVDSNGHAFGAGTFHVLQMCIGIRKLVLELFGSWDPEVNISCCLLSNAVSSHEKSTQIAPKEPTACRIGCICEQQTNWQTEGDFDVSSMKARPGSCATCFKALLLHQEYSWISGTVTIPRCNMHQLENYLGHPSVRSLISFCL